MVFVGGVSGSVARKFWWTREGFVNYMPSTTMYNVYTAVHGSILCLRDGVNTYDVQICIKILLHLI